MATNPDTLARNRFFAIGAMRIVGVLLAMAGFLIIRGVWPLVDPATDRIIGIAFVLIGVFDFAIMPIILARRWRSPKEL